MSPGHAAEREADGWSAPRGPLGACWRPRPTAQPRSSSPSKPGSGQRGTHHCPCRQGHRVRLAAGTCPTSNGGREHLDRPSSARPRSIALPAPPRTMHPVEATDPESPASTRFGGQPRPAHDTGTTSVATNGRALEGTTGPHPRRTQPGHRRRSAFGVGCSSPRPNTPLIRGSGRAGWISRRLLASTGRPVRWPRRWATRRFRRPGRRALAGTSPHSEASANIGPHSRSPVGYAGLLSDERESQPVR